MALVKCPYCGGAISSSALVCPHCGTPKAKMDEIRAEQIRQEELKAAEERRIAEQKAEEKRIRAERRQTWWKKNWWKILIVVIVIALIAVGVVVAIKIHERKTEQRAVQEAITIAKDYIAKGDSCVGVYRFDEAEEYYGMAFRRTDDVDVQNMVQIKRKQIPQARRAAQQEYDDALYKLQIYLEADYNEFTPTSSALLDKMIAIDPYNSKTVYYKNKRDR